MFTKQQPKEAVKTETVPKAETAPATATATQPVPAASPLDIKTKEAADYLNHLKRLQADFENFIKRTDKEKQDIMAVGNAKILGKLLVILDEFEHTLAAIKKDASREDLVKGVEMLYKNFHKILVDEGVHPIISAGRKLDPYLHEVLLTENKPGVPEGTITEELQKGYQLKDKVLRYAKVKIAKS